MITNADITKLKETFTTKEDFADLRLEFGEIRDVVTTFDAKLDRIVGGLDDARMENSAEAATLNRHGRQIQALAAGTGVAIPQD